MNSKNEDQVSNLIVHLFPINLYPLWVELTWEWIRDGIVDNEKILDSGVNELLLCQQSKLEGRRPLQFQRNSKQIARNEMTASDNSNRNNESCSFSDNSNDTNWE